MSFAEKLHNLRKKNNFKQEYLAEKLGVTQQLISQYERGITIPKMDVILKLAQLLGVPFAYFIDNINDQTQTSLSDDALRLLELYDSLPNDKKNISLELLKVLKNTSEKKV